MANKNEIMIVDERSLREKVYVVRGQQVMLDFDLAEIYGYETKNFNRQVKNNIERFEGEDFRFQLTKEEFENLRCNNFTSSWGGTRYMPYAFTEQGIYLLMTVLKGDLAVEQSRKLVRLFKGMKDYLINSQPLLPQKVFATLAEQVKGHSRDIKEIKDSMITRADLSDFIKLFDSAREAEEVLILNGQPFKADIAYQKIYRSAKKSIIVVDDYIGVKTLQHLATAKKTVEMTIVSDNKSRPPLRKSEYDDFRAEFPGRNISFIESKGKVHDRYIVLDNGSRDMKVYLCGSSSKDSGQKKITTILQVSSVSEFRPMINTLLSGTTLMLK